MKRIYATLLFAALFAATSFAQIVAGDIAFTGVNTSGTDDFSFICLKDIPANTEIRFTDGGWKAAGGFRCNENDMSWNSGSSVILSGTQVRLSLTPSASHGSFTAYSISSLCNVSTAAFLGLATDADQIFAYTGTFNSPTLIAAINVNLAWDADATNAQTSANPNIVGGLNLVLNTALDNAVFLGSLTGTRAQILAALNDVTQWSKSNLNFSLPAAGSTALSAELSHFEAKISQNDAILTWQTASEKDNARFDLEHSTDGLTFDKVGEIKGNGTTSEAKNYTFTHPNVAQNMAHYYRLKLIALDEKTTTSSVVSVELKDDKSLKNWVKIYPTIAANELTIEGINPTHSGVDFTIFDAFGRVLLTEKRLYTEGSLFEKINVETINSGVYFLTIKSGELVKTLKFFKQ
jgi:Secretion system C-terminal sorting domain